MLLGQQDKLFKTNICTHSEIRSHTGPHACSCWRGYLMAWTTWRRTDPFVCKCGCCGVCDVCVCVCSLDGKACSQLAEFSVTVACYYLVGFLSHYSYLHDHKKGCQAQFCFCVCVCVLLYCLCKDSQLLPYTRNVSVRHAFTHCLPKFNPTFIFVCECHLNKKAKHKKKLLLKSLLFLFCSPSHLKTIRKQVDTGNLAITARGICIKPHLKI